jgi:hypothetical protein
MEFTKKQVALLQQLVSGIQSQYGASAKLTFTAGTYTSKELVQIFGDLIDAYNAHLEATANARSALAAFRADAARTAPVVAALRGYLVHVFADPKDLAAFGLSPRKARSAPSADTVAEAVHKRRATRKARHTMGKRQRLLVHATDSPPQVVNDAATPNAGTVAH